MNSQFTIDEDQEMETQPIYLSSDESEIDSLSSAPIPQLSNNVPDTYSAITQLIAAQHEQMSLSGISAPPYPITPTTSLISDDENDDMCTLFQTRLNPHPRKINVQETSPVHTIFPMHRHQLRSTTPSISRQ